MSGRLENCPVSVKRVEEVFADYEKNILKNCYLLLISFRSASIEPFCPYTAAFCWWSDFRKDNANDTNWHYFIWNNMHEIRINNKPVFYKRYFNNGIRTVGDFMYVLILIILTLMNYRQNT